jgi:phosphoribosylpyrophosphate synthetase
MKLFVAESAKHLRQNLKRYGWKIGPYESYVFADGERGYRLKEKVGGKSVVLVACVLPNPDSFFEILTFLVSSRRMAPGERPSSFLIPDTRGRIGP